MKFIFAALLIWLTLTSNAQSAESPRRGESALLARWLADQQYSNPGQPSFGGIKINPGVAAVGPDGTAYGRVSPYFSNLAVLGLLRVRAPESATIADRWITWYGAHLETNSAPAGVPEEHFYKLDGSGETTCVKPGDPLLCHHNDATDSAAATFFSVLWAAHQAGVTPARWNTPERKQLVETLAGVLLKLQQTDGLCWAKSDYHVKYLEDNSEVFAGLVDLAQLERTVFNDPARATFYRQAAERVQQGIANELYDPQRKLYVVAKFEDNQCPPASLDKWYPDTQAQFWPHLFGVVAPRDPKTRAVMSAVNAHWNGQAKPDWLANPEQINGGWIEAGAAYAALLAGEAKPVQNYLQAVRRLKFPKSAGLPGFEWPFSVADAGWLLQTLDQMQ